MQSKNTKDTHTHTEYVYTYIYFIFDHQEDFACAYPQTNPQITRKIRSKSNESHVWPQIPAMYKSARQPIYVE